MRGAVRRTKDDLRGGKVGGGGVGVCVCVGGGGLTGRLEAAEIVRFICCAACS